MASTQVGLEAIRRFGIARPRAVGVTFADIDRDGSPDVFLGSITGASGFTLWRNDGSGRFEDVSATHLPPPIVPFPSLGPTQAHDYTGDGHVDFLINAGGNVPGHGRYYLINDGNGRFSNAPASWIPFHALEGFAIATLDHDRDGDLDVVLGHDGLFNFRNASLWHNDGTGRFVDRGPTLRATGDCKDLVAADLDGDGWTDIASGHWAALGVHLNDRAGGFRLHETHAANSNGRITAGDLDGDGDVDLVQDPASVWLNDGLGSFTDVTATHHPGPLSRTGVITNRIVLADIDADGDLDWLASIGMLAGPATTTLDVLLNDGAGVFTRVTRLVPRADPAVNYSCAVGDIDRDGDLDVVHDDHLLGARVLVNTRHQLWAPVSPTVGASFRLHVRSTIARTAFVLASPAPAAIPIPGFGTLRLDPLRAISSPAIGLPKFNEAGVRLDVPDDPRLRGVRLWFQAVFLDSSIPSRGVLSGLWEETIR